MNRALGLHLMGEQVAYALVENRPEQPPRVLASGTVPVQALPSTFRTLSGGKLLRWGLALEEGGQRPSRLPDGWPLRHPSTEALVHPALASAQWEWQLGRIDADDLLLWLRSAELCWSRGEPGLGQWGSLRRTGDLRATLSLLLRRLSQPGMPVALACDRQAPGKELLLAELEGAGHRPRELRPDPAEGGTDLAAAGAALAALHPERPGVRRPAPAARRAGGYWSLFGLLVVCLGLTWWWGRLQEAELRDLARTADLELQQRAGQVLLQPEPLPEGLARALDRREAFLQAFAGVLEEVPEGSLHRLEAVAAEGSRAVELRLELEEGVAGFDPGALGPGLRLRPGSSRDGRILYLG
ncbi:MAG: hypothetical protein ISR76_03125, partial [Planctomycetes bacterium]|nr:hypothetical protein [Planctomycetota bacterium]